MDMDYNSEEEEDWGCPQDYRNPPNDHWNGEIDVDSNYNDDINYDNQEKSTIKEQPTSKGHYKTKTRVNTKPPISRKGKLQSPQFSDVSTHTKEVHFEKSPISTYLPTSKHTENSLQKQLAEAVRTIQTYSHENDVLHQQLDTSTIASEFNKFRNMINSQQIIIDNLSAEKKGLENISRQQSKTLVRKDDIRKDDNSIMTGAGSDGSDLILSFDGTYVYIYIYICIYVHKYIYIYMYIYMHIYAYKCLYTKTNIHIYIHV
jgi:hypothetical protein